MWELNEPKPVKLIVGILAADEKCLEAVRDRVVSEFGEADFVSEVWAFDQTQYYKDQAGNSILRQFVTIEKLIDPEQLAQIKLTANDIERELAECLEVGLPRPVNLDPGVMEPSKLILASTKNFSHRIYIGKKMYAEVTLLFDKGQWRTFGYTFPDYKQEHYFEFFSKVRKRLVEQLKSHL